MARYKAGEAAQTRTERDLLRRIIFASRRAMAFALLLTAISGCGGNPLELADAQVPWPDVTGPPPPVLDKKQQQDANASLEKAGREHETEAIERIVKGG